MTLGAALLPKLVGAVALWATMIATLAVTHPGALF